MSAPLQPAHSKNGGVRAIAAMATLGLLVIFAAGCATQAPRPAWRFLQRQPARVAIIPARNDTTIAGAPITLDKDWEDVLRKAGFQVVGADSVVTMASAEGLTLAEVAKAPAAQLGKSLKVDYLLEDEIVDWGTHYQILRGGSAVSCKSVLIDVRSGAIVWEHDWIMQNTQGGIEQALASALINAMMDVPKQLAKQGVTLSSSTMPYPGMAPGSTGP